MLVTYTPENGFSFAPTVQSIPALIPFLDAWGEPALHYIAWFSHPFSLHRQLETLTDRDPAVISEMRQREQGLPQRPGGPLKYPIGLYERAGYAEAAEALLSLSTIPSYTQRNFLQESLLNYQKIARGLELKPIENDPEKMNKSIRSQSDMQVLIKQTAKDLADEEERIRALLGVGGIISMEMLWNQL